MLGIRQDTTKTGTTVTNKYQKKTPTSTEPGLAVPDAVTIAMGEIAEGMREGLLALAVGIGFSGHPLPARGLGLPHGRLTGHNLVPGP